MKTETNNIADLYVLEGPVTYNEDPFKVVWRKQIKLMEAYKAAGRLSAWPVRLDETGGQAFYRELFGYLEEEIMETAFELEKLWDFARQNDEEGVRSTLISLNEEIADTLHFWIETFIFLGWMPKSFEIYYEDLAREKQLSSGKGEVFKLAFQFSENYLKSQNLQFGTHQSPGSGSFTFFLRQFPETFEQAGSIISKRIVENYETFTFNTVKHLQLAKNCLKNKAWKSKEYEVNIPRFNELLMEAWLNWVLSITLLNMRPAALVQNYLLKNKINHDKITTH